MSPGKLISVVAPVFNEEEGVTRFCERVTQVMEAVEEDYEIILVDDGSRDHTFERIRELSEADGRMKYLRLSRNFGHQAAIFAGIENSSGDAVVTLDSDLQHPPEMIPEMVEKWREGVEIVYTWKDDASSYSRTRRLFMRLFYSMTKKLMGLDLTFGQSDFRLMDRKVVDAIVAMGERRKFIRGQVSWVGFRQMGLQYKVGERHAGESKYTYRRLFQLAFDGIFSFSLLPLRMVFWMGVGVFLFCLSYAVFITVIVLGDIQFFMSRGKGPPGWLSIMVGLFFFAAVQMISLGIVGEYIGRMYEEVKGRPVYLVSEKKGIPDRK